MGGKIPQLVRLEVIRKWLHGYSRDEIAKDTGIGAGTVSGIIQQCRRDDADFDLLRGVAVELRDRDMRIEDFAPLPVDQFFERVRDQSSLADNLGISIGALPSYLVHFKRNIEKQKEEIHRLRLETENEVQRRGATMNLLREYESNKPLIESTKNKLEKVTKERDLCKKELNYVREQYQQEVWESKKEEYKWYADPEEVDKAEKELSSEIGGDHYIFRLRNPGLKEIILDLYRHPSKYVESIRKVIDTYDLGHRQSAK